MNRTPKVVLSNTAPDSSTWQNSAVATGDGAAEVERLKRPPGSALIVFGGVQTVRSLLAARLFDEFWLKVYPVAVGRGGRAFAGLQQRIGLELVSARSFPSGTVALIYTAVR
jgi:dihydrofolate reductase